MINTYRFPLILTVSRRNGSVAFFSSLRDSWGHDLTNLPVTLILTEEILGVCLY